MDKELRRGISLVFVVLIVGLFLAGMCIAQPTVQPTAYIEVRYISPSS